MRLLEVDCSIDVPDSMDLFVRGSRLSRAIQTSSSREVTFMARLAIDRSVQIKLPDPNRLVQASRGFGEFEFTQDARQLDESIRQSIEGMVEAFLQAEVDPQSKPPSQRTPEEQSYVEERLREAYKNLKEDNKRLRAQAKEREDVAVRLLSEWQEMRNRVLELENAQAEASLTP